MAAVLPREFPDVTPASAIFNHLHRDLSADFSGDEGPKKTGFPGSGGSPGPRPKGPRRVNHADSELNKMQIYQF